MTSEEDLKQTLKLYIVLSRAHKAINEMTNHFFQENGVNPTEFAVLELLYHKGRQPLQQIGNKILLASGSITYVIDKLEKEAIFYGFPVHQTVALPMQKLPRKVKRLWANYFQSMNNIYMN